MANDSIHMNQHNVYQITMEELGRHIYIYYKNKNWLQFLFIVKAAVLKQQISKFDSQIQRTEASDHIYFSQRPFINVKAWTLEISNF